MSGRLTGARPAETPHLVHGPRDGRSSRLWRASHPPAHPAVVVTVVFRSPARRCHAASVWPTPSGSMRGGPEAPGTGRTVPLGRGELAIHRRRVFALSLVPRPRMTCSFSGRGKRPLRRAFVVLCAIREAGGFDQSYRFAPHLAPERGVADGRDRVLVWSDPM